MQYLTYNYSMINSKDFNQLCSFLDDTLNCLTFDKVDKNNVYSKEFALPGFKRNEISVDVEGEYIFIKAKNEKRGEIKKTILLEDIDHDSIQSTLEDGILSVFAKKIPTKQSRKIEIK